MAPKVFLYQFYDRTANVEVRVWSELQPTASPIDPTNEIDLGSFRILDSIQRPPGSLDQVPLYARSLDTGAGDITSTGALRVGTITASGAGTVGGALAVGGGLTVGGSLTSGDAVGGTLDAGDTTVASLNAGAGTIQSTGAITAGSLTVTGAAIVAGVSSAGKLKGGSGLPTLSGGPGGGTGPTLSMTAGSTDTAGEVNLTAGTAPAAISGTTLFTLTFSAPYSTAPFVVITPSNLNAGEFSTRPVYVSPTTTSFTTNLSSAAGLTAGTTYTWAYHALQ